MEQTKYALIHEYDDDYCHSLPLAGIWVKTFTNTGQCKGE
jgi:hypothetical protein